MIRIIATSVLLLMCCFAKAQDMFDYRHDFNLLLKESKDPRSVYYYPLLLQRFNQNDSTLTMREILALQIGFTADPAYKPYETMDAESNIQDLIGQKKYREALHSCNELLQQQPVNFTALMEKSFAMMKLNNDSAAFHKQKFMQVMRSVKKSGDGSREHPFFVLSPGDGQTMITHIWGNKIGMMGSGESPEGYFLDMLQMLIEEAEPVLLYFNIDHAMHHKGGLADQIDQAIEQEKQQRK